MFVFSYILVCVCLLYIFLVRKLTFGGKICRSLQAKFCDVFNGPFESIHFRTKSYIANLEFLSSSDIGLLPIQSLSQWIPLPRSCFCGCLSSCLPSYAALYNHNSAHWPQLILAFSLKCKKFKPWT